MGEMLIDQDGNIVKIARNKIANSCDGCFYSQYRGSNRPIKRNTCHLHVPAEHVRGAGIGVRKFCVREDVIYVALDVQSATTGE